MKCIAAPNGVTIFVQVSALLLTQKGFFPNKNRSTDYKFLGVLRSLFPTVPILGLTATATSAVTTDVQKMLNLTECVIFKASFNRANLYYEVLKIFFNMEQNNFRNLSRSRQSHHRPTSVWMNSLTCSKIVSAANQESSIPRKQHLIMFNLASQLFTILILVR